MGLFMLLPPGSMDKGGCMWMGNFKYNGENIDHDNLLKKIHQS